DAAIVRCDQHWVLRDQPLTGRNADPGISSAIAVVVLAHELGPSGANDDCVARPQRLACHRERPAQIVRRNAVRGREHVDALEPRQIDQYATGYQAADILGPELFETSASADFALPGTIEEGVAQILMGECVELGADLAKLGDYKLRVALAGFGYWRRRLGVDVEYAASIDEGLLGIRRQRRPELKH